MEEQKETEKEELDMSKKPKEEVAIFGFGALLNHQKKISKQNEEITRLLDNRIAFVLSFIEKKLDKIIEILEDQAKKQ